MSTKKTLHEWAIFFDNKGLDRAISDSYLAYISTLLDNDVPIIFDFNHLSLLLGRQVSYLASVVNSPINHYRRFNIKKRSGGHREITMPYPALIEMQYWIFDKILKSVPINYCAHGFAFKKSILTNAKIHAGQKELLKIDLKNFFPSIEINRVISVFKSLGYPNKIAFYLASICCYDGFLPQGAPTSPVLSNIVARNLDRRLLSFAKRFGLKYTRYADDLTFSGESIPVRFIDYIARIVIAEGFVINETKTRLYRTHGKRIVTGISVADPVVKLPRDYKRALRQELHFIFKFGIVSHMKKMKIRKVNYIDSIIGKVNFWLSVEPEDEIAQKAKNKLLEMRAFYPLLLQK